MYRTLAFHEDADIPTQQVFSIESIRESKIETIQGHKTSRRTIIICSLILISITGLLATWLFIAKPHFYPKLDIVPRSLYDEVFLKEVTSKSNKNGELEHLEIHRRGRRSIPAQSLIEQRFRRKAPKKNNSKRRDETATKNNKIYEIVKNPKSYPYNSSRLPLDLIPVDYYLHLKIDMDKDNFTGTVKIKLQCEKKTGKVIFHGRQIMPTNITVLSGQSVISYRKVSYIKKFEMFVVELNSELEDDNVYDVIVDYTVGFGKSLAGLYKSYYKDGGVEKQMCSTHFEPTDARSAFPCLDEPFFKAVFHISITHDGNYTTLSNMPLVKTTESGVNNTVTDDFAPTVKMSTYLVAFSVNQLKYKEKRTPDGVSVRVYAREDDQERINYAVEAAATIIHFYGTFFDIKYPLPKLDLLAVPDFMAGAMEDWGLVSFRSAYLVVDNELSTIEQIRQVTLVIAHELAHQWFGNLVTMKWWNDIWLNEGFANFVEMLGTNRVNPQFNALDLQVPTGWQAAISLDSLNSSHPVSQDVQQSSEIDELFDTISYNKGASLLRMVQSFLGENLENGVRMYLEAYNYSNAQTDDLWKYLTLASNNELNIKEIMDTWTKQRSFPIVTVERIDENHFKLTQQSFLQAKLKRDLHNTENTRATITSNTSTFDTTSNKTILSATNTTNMNSTTSHNNATTLLTTKNTTLPGTNDRNVNSTTYTNNATLLATNNTTLPGANSTNMNSTASANNSTLLATNSTILLGKNSTNLNSTTNNNIALSETNSTANLTTHNSTYSRTLANNISSSNENYTLWNIPFTYITDADKNATLVWFKEKEKIISLPSKSTWLKGNNNTNGFYIVNYDHETWSELIKTLRRNHKAISPLDRAGLLHDSFKLVCEQMLDPIIVLNLTRYLRYELEFIPFSMLRSKCECVSILLHEKPLKQKYMKYIWRLQSHLEIPEMLEDRSNVHRMTVFERMQRFETISFALKHNFSRDLKEKVSSLFNKMVTGEKVVGFSPENRALALMYGFNVNKTSHLDYLWDVFRTSPLDSDRRTIMRALPQFKSHINETLSKAIDKNITRVQDTISLLSQIVKVGFRKDVWDFVIKHYEELKERYGGGYQMGQLFSEVAGGFNTKDMYQKVENFLDRHPIGEKNSRTTRQILEKIKNNINRHSNATKNVEFAEKVHKWLQEDERIHGKPKNHTLETPNAQF